MRASGPGWHRWFFGYVFAGLIGFPSFPSGCPLHPIMSLFLRPIPSKIMAFIPSTSIARHQAIHRIIRQPRHQMAVNRHASVLSSSGDAPDDGASRLQELSSLSTAPSVLDIHDVTSRNCTLVTFGATDHTGTGIGVSLVDHQHPDNDIPFDNEKSIGVFFEQHRSLYEKEYTALIVALEWLNDQKHKSSLVVKMCIRDDIVFNQLLGIYPVQKESLQRLRRKTLELIEKSPCEIRLELSTNASLYKGCQYHANRVLLIEKSDQNAVTFHDPLAVASDLLIQEEILLNVFTNATVAPAETIERSEDAPPQWTDIDEELELAEYMLDSPLGATDDYLLDKVAPSESTDDRLSHMAVTESVVEQELAESASDLNLAIIPKADNLRPAIDPQQTYVLQFDGGSRGNPGRAACGMVVLDGESNVVWEGAKYLGDGMTNNQAEYIGVLLGLKHAHALGIRKLRCEGDSNLIIQQLKGKYRVKNEGLKPLYQSSKQAMQEFDQFKLVHIYREKNKAADYLANVAMDDGASFGLIVDELQYG